MKPLFTTKCVKSNIVGTPSHIFLMVICRSYFPGNLPQLFTVAICREYLPRVCFVYVSKPFYCVIKSFFFVNNSLLIKTKKTFLLKPNLFSMWAKLFLFMRISLLTVFLFVIALAVVGHRNFQRFNSVCLTMTKEAKLHFYNIKLQYPYIHPVRNNRP